MGTTVSAVTVESERSPQWQGRELEALLEGMEARYAVLYGKFSATISKTDKDKQCSQFTSNRLCLKYARKKELMYIIYIFIVFKIT